MAQVPEIPASAYTPEMETLGVILDIPVFEGDRIPVNRNALTSGTRPLQFLSAPSSDFPVRYNTDVMRGFQSEDDLSKARAGGSSTDASAFWDLLDPPMRSRVIIAGFGDYALGLRRTQPRFPPVMRYALMERWNDCTHSFIFGLGEMTLTPTDFTAITGLGFDGDAVPLDSRYQTTALAAELVATLLGVTTRTRYTSQGYVSYEVMYKFWAERSRARLSAWMELPADDLSLVGTYDWASLALAHLYHGLDVWTRGSGESNWQFLSPLEVWAYEYRIYPGGPESGTLAEAWRIPRYLYKESFEYHLPVNTQILRIKKPVFSDCKQSGRTGGHFENLSELFLTSWEGDAWTVYAPRVRAEALTRSRVLLQGYWLDRYYLRERVFEIRTAKAQRRVPVAPPRHMCTLDGMTPEDRLLEYGDFPADDYLVPGDYASYLSTRLRTRLPDAETDAPAGPTGVVLGDISFPPGMEVTLDPTLGLGPTLAIPADLRQVPAQRYQELYQRFCFARTYIARLYPEHCEMMENDRLRTRLEVEGIPLDFLDKEEDDDDEASSDDAPPPPPSSVRHAAAGPSQRRR
ncbi:hypothetical protein JCGZ_15525 [Jatropha curcas]|uniref:Aminotransferase-like plant mobile domain-containing protein n=1 Tax=Jatropha curcas TaxID=180498 RepID=A0A067KFZ3_JATCU|nr:hypothetical protein JCGZ_15525 [Jatropha curcas]